MARNKEVDALLMMGNWMNQVAKNDIEMGLATHTARMAIEQAVHFIATNTESNDLQAQLAIDSLRKTHTKIEEKLDE